MNFIIGQNFKKSLPLGREEIILNKIKHFQNQLIESKGLIRELPSGFWVRKIRNTNIFKFRINSGDRILFSFEKTLFEHSDLDRLVFLEFVKHDNQVVYSNRLDTLELSLDEYILEESEDRRDEELCIKNYYSLDKFIAYEIKSDEYIRQLLDTKNEDYLYYLNKEQYKCLIKETPVLISGSAGSGKTTIGIRKLLALSDGDNNYKTIAYFTYTDILKDKSLELFNKYRFKFDKNVVFFSLIEYYLQELKLSRNSIFGYNDFKEWVTSQNDFSKLIKETSIHVLWTEIRGVVKGSMLSDWNRKLNENIIDLESYKKLSHKFSDFKEEKREEVYNLTRKYNRYLKDHGKLDENDLALEVINKIENLEKFDFIICDEVQDLSEIQIYMLRNLLLDTKEIYLSGDVHQIVNPTYFSFGRLTNMFYSLENKNIQVNVLSKNYRSQKSIVELANKLVEIRKNEIGSFGEDDYIEEAIRDGEKPLLLSYNKRNINQILRASEVNAKFVIVVSDDETLIELKNINPNSRVFTVGRIKGLEYEHVACINVISKNLKHLISEDRNAKRHYFNYFYVAITRSIENLYILEENSDNYIFNNIKELLNCEKFNMELDVKASSSIEWDREAIRLEKSGLFQEAAEAYSKAAELDKEKSFDYYEKAGNAIILKNEEIALFYYRKAEKHKASLNQIFELKRKIEICLGKPVDVLKSLEKNNDIDLKMLAIRKIKKDKLSKKDKKYLVNLFTKNGDYANLQECLEILEFIIKTEADTNLKKEILMFLNNNHSEILKDFLDVNSITESKIENHVSKTTKKQVKKLSRLELKNMSKELISASQNGHIRKIKKLISAGADIDLAVSGGWVPIITASENGKIEVVKELILAGANLDLQEVTNGSTALIAAVEDGQIEIARELIKSGANLNLQDKNGLTALTWATYKNDFLVLKELIETGANLDLQTNTYSTALIVSIENGHLEIARELILAGANLDLQAYNGLTPLIMSVGQGFTEIAKKLIKSGANLDLQDKDGFSALIASSHKARTIISKELIEAGANVDLQSKSGYTALILASSEGQLEIVKELIKVGANLNLKDDKGRSALIWSSMKGYLEITKKLIKAGSILNLQDDVGATALIWSCQEGYLEITKKLIEAGANLNLQDNKGCSSLILAISRGHIDIAKELIRAGINLDLQANNGVSSLILSIQRGYFDLAKHLIEKGADVFLENNDGINALMVADELGYKIIEKELHNDASYISWEELESMIK